MSWPWRVAAYDAVVVAALEAAQRAGVYAIVRLQDRRDWSLQAQAGKLEWVAAGRAAGLAVQAFTRSGHCGFASSDEVEPAEAERLVRRAAALASAAVAAGAEASQAVFELTPEPGSAWPGQGRSLDETPQPERREALLEAHREALELAEGFGTSSSLSLTDDEWRVARSDGTDVRYRMPRGIVRHRFTARGAGGAASANCDLVGADDRVLLDGSNQQRLRLRALQALQRARDVASASSVEGGSYRLVLDHSMAKGLAHEAFGHAAETDVAEGSILATEGRLRLGEQVARAGLSIVDGPLDGDYAYQPLSPNGLRRQTVEIIRDGVLRSGLGDPFSAAQAGSPVTGAERAASVHSRPIPRMSNIRLLLDRSEPLDALPESLQPAEARERLAAAGLLEGRQPTLFLSGYRGGQVSPVLGDFVFNCAAIYDLTDGAAPRRPAVFSGKCLSALRSISGALGGLQLDSPGQCVKYGQPVPSCGGSHAYVVLDPHPEVRVGG